MIPLTGYADRLSVRPGETIRFHVANATGAEVGAKVVRVRCADPNPAVGGVRIEPVSGAGLAVVSNPGVEEPGGGSSAWFVPYLALNDIGDFTIVLTIFATRLGPKPQSIIGAWDDDGSGWGLVLDADGRLGLDVRSAGAGARLSLATSQVLSPSTWTRVALSFDKIARRATVGVRALASRGGGTQELLLDHAIGFDTDHSLQLAGAFDDGTLSTFNGKIENPRLYDRVLAKEAWEALLNDDRIGGAFADWDLSREAHTQRIIDIGPRELHGTLFQTPTRAVRGSNWTGREHCFRHAPEQYGAIHFHDDDIDDCRWPVTHEYTVPADLKSGAYALMLEAGGEQENIPFFVVPPKGKPKARLAVLVSTFTYTVYGNHARPEWSADPKWRAAWIKQTADWKGYPHNPGAHPEYGLSTYNHHTDGSGISIASWHRPMFNLRIGYITYPYPEIRGSGLRHYPADSHLLAWLDAKGFDYDLITDWELHHEGYELLRDYTCVMTGSHPEYHTAEMLDALEAYTQRGGRFMYMGGNGFYWKIALSPEKPGVIEIRRAEGGIRAWAAEPGEYYNQFDGEYGGLWRRNARPPQLLVGVGFTAQGNFVGSYYRVTPEARSNPRTGWMFEGVDGEIIGNFGFSGHGAAGFELDRADPRLGTAAHAVVVARSENHPPDAPWVLVPEEQLTHITTIPGQSHKQLIHADMTFFETPGNGAVFSTGSITFCGSLPHNNFDNDVSRLTENVLRRFLRAGDWNPGR